MEMWLAMLKEVPRASLHIGRWSAMRLLPHYLLHNYLNEKAPRETQTLRAGCSKAEPKISPRRRPPSRGRRTAKI